MVSVVSPVWPVFPYAQHEEEYSKLTGVENCDFCRQHVGVDEVYEKGEKQIRLGKQQRNKSDDVGTYVTWSTHSYEKYCSCRLDYTIRFVYS